MQWRMDTCYILLQFISTIQKNADILLKESRPWPKNTHKEKHTIHMHLNQPEQRTELEHSEISLQ